MSETLLSDYAEVGLVSSLSGRSANDPLRTFKAEGIFRHGGAKMLTDEPLPPTKQKLEFCNEGTRPIEVQVEMIPNRYVLLPKDKLVLIADVANAPRNEGYTLNVSDNFVQIYAAWDVEPEAYVNGKPAKSDWVTQVD